MQTELLEVTDLLQKSTSIWDNRKGQLDISKHGEVVRATAEPLVTDLLSRARC